MQEIGRPASPYAVDGSSEHAAAMTERRWPEVRDRMQWLTYAHLPEELRKFSAPFYQAAQTLLMDIRKDSDELVLMLDKMIETKDAAMRAGIRFMSGRAGSVPRPQEVVDPPQFVSNQQVRPPYYPPGAR